MTSFPNSPKLLKGGIATKCSPVSPSLIGAHVKNSDIKNRLAPKVALS
jgi:hypothetical protein